MVRGRQHETRLAGGVGSDSGVMAASSPHGAMSAEAFFVDAGYQTLDSVESTAQHSRHLSMEMWKPAVGVVVGVVGLLLLLLACCVFCRWRRRLRLMKKTVKDFPPGVVDVEAQTNYQANTADPSRPNSAGNASSHPPVEKVEARHVVSATPPSPHSSSCSESRTKTGRSKASALLPTPTNQDPPKGLAPTPPIPVQPKHNRMASREAAALRAIPIKPIEAKQNRVEEGPASPMTAMSTQPPLSFKGVPPTRWEHQPVDLVQAAKHKRSASLLAGNAAGGIAEDDASCATTLQRKSSSFERARSAIIGFDLDISKGALDSASGSMAIDGLRSGTPAAPTSSVRDPPPTSHAPLGNMRADSACGSVAMDWPRASRRNTFAGDSSARGVFGHSQHSMSGSVGGGGRRTLEDAGVFESFASLPRGDYTFDSNNSANTTGVIRVKASSALAGSDSYNASSIVSSWKPRHPPMSPIDRALDGGYESVRPRAHSVEGDAIVLEDASRSSLGDLRETLRHRRSKTDFPSPRRGEIDFRWDSAAGSAFRESSTDNSCPGCLGTGVQFDSASGSVFPQSSTGTPGTADSSRCKTSSRFDGESRHSIVYGDTVDGVDVGNVESGGVRCYCVRDPIGRNISEGRRTMQGGRERSFSVSALPNEGSLSYLFGKE